MKPSMRMSHFNKIDVQKWLQDRRFSNYRVSPEKKTTINSHGMRWQCTDILLWRFRCLQVKSDMSYVFLVPKKSIRGLKNVISGQFSVNFR